MFKVQQKHNMLPQFGPVCSRSKEDDSRAGILQEVPALVRWAQQAGTGREISLCKGLAGTLVEMTMEKILEMRSESWGY